MATLADLTSNIGNFFKGSQTFDYRSPERQSQEGPLATPAPQSSFQMPSIQLPKFDIGSALSGTLNNIFHPAPSQPVMYREPKHETLRFSDVHAAEPSETPVATPYPQAPNDGFRFAYETMPRDQGWTQNGPRPNFQPKQPPANIGDIIRKIFPNEATAAATVAASEDGRFEPRAQNLWNAPGQGIDRGIFAINENTFNGLMDRQGDKLKQMGINSFEDMFDPEKNAQVAKLIKDGAQAYRPGTNPNGWGGWYGWQDTGYDLNNGWYSKPDRGEYQDRKKKGKR